MLMATLYPPRPVRLTRGGGGSRMAKSWRPRLLAGPRAAAV